MNVYLMISYFLNVPFPLAWKSYVVLVRLGAINFGKLGYVKYFFFLFGHQSFLGFMLNLDPLLLVAIFIYLIFFYDKDSKK